MASVASGSVTNVEKTTRLTYGSRPSAKQGREEARGCSSFGPAHVMREERKGLAQLGPLVRKGNRPVRAVFQAEKRRGQIGNELSSLANMPKGEKVKFILFIFIFLLFSLFPTTFSKEF
jgi:hypothetical protein